MIKAVERREAGTVGAETETFRFVISTETEDRYDSTLAVDGWKLAHYRANPVVMWAHRIYSDPPIGRSVSIDVEGKELVAEVEFVKREVYPFAGMVRDLVAGGFLRAASVSWDPIKWAYNEERSYWAVDYIEQELLEWSIVPVPGNPDTLLEARAAGVDLDPLAGWAEEQLDHLVGRELAAEEIGRVTKLEALRRAAGRTAKPIFFMNAEERAAAETKPAVSPESLDARLDARLLAAVERIEKAAAERAAPVAVPPAPVGISEAQSQAILETIRSSARAATRELVTKATGQLD